MTDFEYVERIPRFAGLQNEGTSIFDERAAKAFGQDARKDGLILCHNPYCPAKAKSAWLAWFQGWACQKAQQAAIVRNPALKQPVF